MKEHIVTMNAQITYIARGNDVLPEEIIRSITEKDFANVIKKDLQCDDVVVSDLKLFVLDKEEESHEADE